MQGTYTFKLRVSPNSTLENNKTIIVTNETNDDDNEAISDELKAEISKISIQGQVTVTFNSRILIPANYTHFNRSVLILKILLPNGKID